MTPDKDELLRRAADFIRPGIWFSCNADEAAEIALAIDEVVPPLPRLIGAMQALSNVMVWATLEARSKQGVQSRARTLGYAIEEGLLKVTR